MKVRIYKAPNGKGMFKSSMPKARQGAAVDMDMDSYIDQQLEEGLDPEVIIIGLNESYGKSRGEVKDLVYEKFFNNDFAYQDDDEEEVAAPYDTPVEDTEVQPEEEEQDNAAAYGYYDDNRQGVDLVQEGADEEEEDEGMARYGGQYADGGQFAPGSIIPQPKKPYYIGMDAEPFDNAYKQGGMTKGQYVKQRIKELRKAAQGDEVKNNETNISPRGTIDSPSGFTTPEKNVASIIKQTGNEAKLKETAENEYQQYQESTMGDNFNGKFLFGGRNRKIKRANKALFGTPMAIPGVDVSYEFGPLGGLRKATADWDLDAIGGLAKFLPGMAGMMPGMGGNYKAVSYPAQIRKKTISTINNAALDDVAKQNPNSDAAQNNRSDKKNEIKCPPGSVYDADRGHCVDELGNMVRSIIDLPDPEELLGNPFENPNARMLSGKKTMKATGPSSSASSTAASQSTQASVSGGAPLQSQQGIIPGFVDYNQDWVGNVAKADEMFDQAYGKQQSLINNKGKDPSQYGYMIDPATGKVVKNPKGTDVDQRGLVWSGKYDENSSDVDESLVWSNPYSPEEFQKSEDAGNYSAPSYIVTNPDGTQSSVQGYIAGSEFSPWYNKMEEANAASTKAMNQKNSYLVNMPKEIRAKNYKEINDKYGINFVNPDGSFSKDYSSIMTPENYPVTDYDFVQKAFGGSINNIQPDEYGNLQRFVYGGDEYAYGGDVLPKAYTGFQANFGRQMLELKDKIKQMGRKNPADFNLFKGNAFGKATTGIEPSGTVGNRFQSNGEPKPVASTTENKQEPGAPKQTTTTTTTEGQQPQMDPNTMAQFQQYMQMMQGQQGAGQNQSWTGRPQRLGFGLTRDFNYGSSSSPVDWKVPEGTKHLRQETYKDRGKWYNPFDTKRITDYYADPEEKAKAEAKAGSDDLINKEGSDKNIKTATTNESSTGDQSAKDKLIASGWDPSELTTQEEIDQAIAHDELINSGAKMNYGEPPTSMQTLSTAPNLPDKLESLPPTEMPKNASETELENNPFTGNAFEGNQFGTAAGVTPSENMRFTQGPNNFSPSANTSNEFAGNAFGTSSTGITGNANMSRPAAPSPTYPQPGVENPMADPKFVPTPQDYNPGSGQPKPRVSGIRRDDPNAAPGEMYNDSPETGLGYEDPLGEMPMAYGGYMADGGYIPEYMAYGGYMPHAKNGITVENPEFSDPNFIGREIENSAYTFNPGQFATDMVAGAKIATNVGNAWNVAKQSNLMAQQNRSSDAAKANTGQSGFGSAEVTGTDADAGQMGSKGHYDQYGVNVGSTGYSGNNLITKKGGSINSQYSKGKVYSLTSQQIKAIEAAGGKVEYIK
jgi:hypothetical protein